MKIVNKIFLILIVSLLISYGVSFGKSAIQIQSNREIIKKEEQVEVNINFGQNQIAAFTLEVYFDTNKLEYVSSPENSNYSNNRIIYTWVSNDGKGKENLQIEPFVFKAIALDGVASIIATGEFYNSNGETIEIENTSLELLIGEPKELMKEDKTEENEIVESNNTNLKILRLNKVGISPEFSKDIKEYYFIADSTINDLEITAVPENSNSNVIVTGNRNIKMGLNTINITVESEDKTNYTDYKIYVTKTKDKEKANANLENLAVRQASLNPEFDANITKYKLEIANSVEQIDILAVPQKNNAKVQIEKQEKLEIGDNKIEITVVAEDGITNKRYEIIAHRRDEVEEEQKQKEQQEQAQRLSTILEQKEAEENNQKIDDEEKENKSLYIFLGIFGSTILIGIIALIIKKRNKKM